MSVFSYLAKNEPVRKQQSGAGLGIVYSGKVGSGNTKLVEELGRVRNGRATGEAYRREDEYDAVLRGHCGK